MRDELAPRLEIHEHVVCCLLNGAVGVPVVVDGPGEGEREGCPELTADAARASGSRTTRQSTAILQVSNLSRNFANLDLSRSMCQIVCRTCTRQAAIT